MVDKQTIGISSLIMLGMISLSMIIPGYFDSPLYYCEQRPELGLIQCDSFSKYVADNGKCIDNDGPNYICRQGWIKVTNDLDIKSDKISYEDNNKRQEYQCNNKGCHILK